MNKKSILKSMTIIFIIIIFTMLPSKVHGSDFYYKGQLKGTSTAPASASMLRVYYQARAHGADWLKATAPSNGTQYNSEYGYVAYGVRSKLGDKAHTGVPSDGLIYHKQGICFGHQSQTNGSSGKLKVYTLDINLDKDDDGEVEITDSSTSQYTGGLNDTKIQQVAYYAWKGTQDNANVGGIGSSPSKALICDSIIVWLQNKGLKSQKPEHGVNAYTQKKSKNNITDLKNKATTYANGVFSQVFEKGKATDVTIEKVGKKYFIGPYNIKSSGGVLDNLKTAPLTGAKLTKKDGTEIDAVGVSTNGKTSRAFSKVTTINGNIWLVFNEKITSDDIKTIKLTKTHQFIKARLVAGIATGGKGAQDIAVFYGKWAKETLKLNLAKPSDEGDGGDKGNLRITKCDEDDKSKKLANVTFKIKNKDTNKWVKATTSGSQYVASSYVASESSGTSFVTDSNGKIEIKNLRVGNYTIKETANANAGYESNIGETWNKKVVKSKTTETTWSKITITNEKSELGGLVIKKVNEDNKKVPLSNVEFYICRVPEDVKFSEWKTHTYYVDRGHWDYDEVPRLDSDGNTVYDANGNIVYDEDWYYVSNDVLETHPIGDDDDDDERVNDGETWTIDYDVRLPGGYLKANGSNGVYTISSNSDYVGENINQRVEPATATAKDVIPNQCTFYTNSNGKITVDGLCDGKYIITEVRNPDDYYSDDLPKTQIVTITNGSTKTVTFTNKQTFVDLSGYVWLDKQSGKQSERNDLYRDDDDDSADELKEGITVRLMRAVNGRTQLINSAETDSNGAYEFKKVALYDENDTTRSFSNNILDQYYIEFEYNGILYTNVDPIENEENGSKAAEDATVRDNFNKKFSYIEGGGSPTKGVARDNNRNKTYDLNYKDNGDHTSSFITNEKEYPIVSDTNSAGYDMKTYYIAGTRKLENINLGLYLRDQPDLALIEDIDNVKISLNGYEHTYEYAQRFKNQDEYGDGFNIGVKFGMGEKYGKMKYTREIYSSDISYNEQEGNEGKLEVKITYKIALKNESNVYSKVNSIVNYFDSRYYFVEDNPEEPPIYTLDDNDNKASLEYGEITTQDGLKKVTINANQNIEPQEMNYIYIEYKLNNDAVNAVLNNDVDLKNSVSEITSYSLFTDANYNEIYAGIDSDSNPESVTGANNNDQYQDDTDSSPAMKLTVKEGRVIKGTVWEDSPIAEYLDKEGYEKQRIGDGLYQSEENVVENVQVDLLKMEDESGFTQATLYKQDSTTESAIQNTNNKGEYEFSGVIPGNYILCFTYANGNKIYKSTGEEAGEINNVDLYKSTIYRGGQDEEDEEDIENTWYRTDKELYSDAVDKMGTYDNVDFVDIVEERTNPIDSITYKNIDKNLQNIKAETKQLQVAMDYDIDRDSDRISSYGDKLQFEFGNIDFGIIERPRQLITVKKEVAYIELQLANGQVIITGDPRKGNLKYVKQMPSNDSGKWGNVSIEMDNELIQGSKLTITWAIIVDNTKAEIDYNDRNYYIKGKVPLTEEERKEKFKLATIKTIFDYSSNNIIADTTSEPNEGKWVKVADEELEEKLSYKEDKEGNSPLKLAKNYDNVLKTNAFENMEPGSKDETVTLTTSKLLSNSDDLTFDNDIEIVELKERRMQDLETLQYITPGSYIPGYTIGTEEYKATHEVDDDRNVLIITGPTGLNKEYKPYIILGISCLGIFVLGIVIIRKIILK